MQKEFFKSCEGFLRAALTVHGHPGPVQKIAKMALFDLCMELEKTLGQITSFDFYDSYEFLAMLEGKIREAPFFKGSIW